MIKIAVVTATRAEYGLLYPVINRLREFETKELVIELIVTGTHLDSKFGMTINEIEKDNIRIDKQVCVSVKSDIRLDISINQAEILTKFSKLFQEELYSAILILGDRYEMLMIAIAAMNMQIPIIHLYGGDTTEGAIDESIRHSITKMSHLHFVTNEISRKRVIQLGENPQMVFNYGAPGIDNILNLEKMSREEALISIGLKNDIKYALCTYHPVTLENVDIEKQIIDFIDALSRFKDLHFIITKSNADYGGALINDILDREEKKHGNIHVFKSLGLRRYLSLMQFSEAVIGNSSSGIMEAPAFGIPTVNIGDRQKGRLQANSTINCSTDVESITNAIKYALSDDMKKRSQNTKNPYGDGTASGQIARKIIEFVNCPIELKKEFYNLKL